MIVEANPVAVQWLLDWYLETRKTTADLCAPLAIEDHVVQTSADVSPPSWHLGHTTWFFETFILGEFLEDYTIHHSSYPFLFNSYYEAAGERIHKINRGFLSRPTVEEIHGYRAAVDEAMSRLLRSLAEQSDPSLVGSSLSLDGKGDGAAGEHSDAEEAFRRILELTELGIHHEKQHQELLLMDIKHNFFCNPLYPVYGEKGSSVGNPGEAATRWLESRRDPAIYHLRSPLLAEPADVNEEENRILSPFVESLSARTGGLLFDHSGLAFLGHGDDGFGYDNEYPRHAVYLHPFWIASRPVTNGEYLQFLEAGGYCEFRHWLSAGWQWVQQNSVTHPYYWRKVAEQWEQWTLDGWQTLDPDEPVMHLTFFEADAFASFRGKRLPTEGEWELAARVAALREMDFEWGRVWEWTGSAYRPYPGFRPASGAVGEYNGKFMIDQMVLRGACDLTPVQHSRITYRNFYPAASAWQMSGFRLAEDA